jgi:hypothetical protein
MVGLLLDCFIIGYTNSDLIDLMCGSTGWMGKPSKYE